MSAYFSHNTGTDYEYLSGTITVGDPAYTDNKLVTAWLKWEDVASVGGVAVALFPSSDAAYMELTASGSNLRGRFKYDVNSNLNVSRSTFFTNTWHFAAVYLEGMSGSFDDCYTYLDNVSIGSSMNTSGDTGSEDFDQIIIGNDVGPEHFNRWEGWIEDVAVWAVTDRTQAETIISQIWNSGSGKRADNISEATPDYYVPLISDANVEIGTGALSESGSGTVDVTYDAGETPGLIAGGGGGGAAVQHVGHFV